MSVSSTYRNTPERFWRRVDQAGDCWVWTGSKTPHGYGTVRWSGDRLYSHRLAYTLANGPIPDGMFVCHRCDNPPCVRPDHLWLGTNADNIADRHQKGRTRTSPPFGENASTSKLRAVEVIALREAHAAGATLEALARRYGVHHNTVQAIVVGKNWRSVGGPIRAAKPRRRPARRMVETVLTGRAS